MIQRIQSIFLAVIIIISFLAAQQFSIKLLSGSIGVLSLINIFLFSERSLQKIICFIIGGLSVIWLVFIANNQQISNLFWVYGFVMIVLSLLAANSIHKDGMLVHSTYIKRNNNSSNGYRSNSLKGDNNFILEKIIAPIIVSVVSGIILWFFTGQVVVGGGVTLIGSIISITLFGTD